MSRSAAVSAVVTDFKANGRIVIVGASLAGLRGAEALRDNGFNGPLTIIGDEPHEPYDRPPLSKQVLKGWVPADHTKLPRLRTVDAEWRLGVAATGLDRAQKQVLLKNGEKVPFDRLLIATGVRSRPWFNPAEAALKGVFTLRTSGDAARLQAALAENPRRVLIIGAGFIGSEIASVCRELGLAVTVAERAAAPLVGALGGVIGKIAAEIQRDHGVDLRTRVSVEALQGDGSGHVRSARLSDGSTLEVDVVLAPLGSLRNVEWLADAGLASGFWGVACDAGCRAFDINGVVTDSIFVAGDIAGHDSTVNLIAHCVLTVLRNEGSIDRLRLEPELIPGAVEEVLRLQSSVQFFYSRSALADIEIAGTVIPKGAPIFLMYGAGNRDPKRFPNPNQFDPARKDNEHLGWGSGIHSCFGGPLARLEVNTAFEAFLRRVENPRLVVDPPPYRRNQIFRGPRHLLVDIDGIHA